MSLIEKLERNIFWVAGSMLALGFGAGYTVHKELSSYPEKNPVAVQPTLGSVTSPTSSGNTRTVDNTPRRDFKNDTIANPFHNQKPADLDEPASNVTNAVGFVPIIKEDGPLYITLKSVNRKTNTLVFALSLRNTGSGSIKVGLDYSNSTKVFINGKVYTPSKYELAGKEYRKYSNPKEEIPRGESLNARIVFEGFPEDGKPSTLQLDYFYKGSNGSSQSNTHSFKLL